MERKESKISSHPIPWIKAATKIPVKGLLRFIESEYQVSITRAVDIWINNFQPEHEKREGWKFPVFSKSAISPWYLDEGGKRKIIDQFDSSKILDQSEIRLVNWFWERL